MERSTTVFYDVDTQRDFLEPDGALYVPAGAAIGGQLARLTHLARGGVPRIRVLGSVCRHHPGDPELARNGGAYPDHCMDGTPGQRKIAATAPPAPRWIENRAYDARELEVLCGAEALFFEKQEFDVLTGNRNAAVLLPRLLAGARDVIVYGVVTEVCVDHAVRALVGRGPLVHVVTDAIAAVERARAARCLEEWRAEGVDLTTADPVARALDGAATERR